MTPAMFREATDVSRETLDRLTAFADCLTRWQQRMNLVGRGTMQDLWRRHMLDSAQLVRYMPPTARSLTDLGSGAGFPGLVLAIMTGIETHLVEADGRKAAFLREAARHAEVAVEIHNVRIETLKPWPCDVITARALSPLPKLLSYAWPFFEISNDATPVCLFLKGAAWQRELTAATKMWHMRVENALSTTDPSGCVLVLRDLVPTQSGPTDAVAP